MFLYTGRNKRVKIATKMANQLMQNHEGFIDLIKARTKKFQDTEVDCEDIALFMVDRFYNDAQVIIVSKRYNPFGSVKASFNKKRPCQIKLNGWNLRRSVDGITGSIIHEFVHLVDNYYTSARFGHAYHNHEGRDDTAPYAIGKMAKNHSLKTID